LKRTIEFTNYDKFSLKAEAPDGSFAVGILAYTTPGEWWLGVGGSRANGKAWEAWAGSTRWIGGDDMTWHAAVLSSFGEMICLLQEKAAEAA
jgi:hypothetical protein